nr:OmpA family protein [Pseudomonadota bacterium]
PLPQKDSQTPPPPATPDPLARVAQRIQQTLPALIRSDLVTVRRTGQWVEIEIKNSILFPSGSAVINPQALEPLRQIAAILADVPHRVQVEGFTDDQPISTPVFPSNWELSAARAASVVHLLTRNGVAPQRLAAVGYGEFRPVADNATAGGRERNRRVVLVIRSEEDIRRTTGPPAL